MNADGSPAGMSGTKATIMGFVLMLLGVICMVSPMVVGISVIRVIGVLVGIAGLIRIFSAIKSESREILTLIVGVLMLMCGVSILANPVFGAGVLTILLAIYFVFDGVLEIAAGFRIRPAPGWGFLLFSGFVSLLLGVMIWKQFPLSGAWAIGVLLGIKLFFAGFVMIAVGSAVRRMGKA
jgi:uncharacterized membrane protein HdeD (DUF308 family)